MNYRLLPSLLFMWGLFLQTFPSFSQTSSFPSLPLKGLVGKEVTLPDSFKGTKVLALLSYSPKSEKYLEAWLKPIFNHFIASQSNPLNIPSDEKTQVMFIPMLTGIYQVVDNQVYNKMKASIDPAFHPYIFMYAGPVKPYKESLKLGEKDVPYLYVIDGSGTILHQTKGEYSDAKMEEILKFFE